MSISVNCTLRRSVTRLSSQSCTEHPTIHSLPSDSNAGSCSLKLDVVGLRRPTNGRDRPNRLFDTWEFCVSNPLINPAPLGTICLLQGRRLSFASLDAAVADFIRRSSFFQAADNPSRGCDAKFYSLTRTGERQLTAETAGWKRLCDAISLVLEHVE